MEGTRSLRDEPNYYIDDPTLNTQAGRTRYKKGKAFSLSQNLTSSKFLNEEEK